MSYEDSIVKGLILTDVEQTVIDAGDSTVRIYSLDATSNNTVDRQIQISWSDGINEHILRVVDILGLVGARTVTPPLNLMSYLPDTWKFIDTENLEYFQVPARVL